MRRLKVKLFDVKFYFKFILFNGFILKNWGWGWVGVNPNNFEILILKNFIQKNLKSENQLKFKRNNVIAP